MAAARVRLSNVNFKNSILARFRTVFIQYLFLSVVQTRLPTHISCSSTPKPRGPQTPPYTIPHTHTRTLALWYPFRYRFLTKTFLPRNPTEMSVFHVAHTCVTITRRRQSNPLLARVYLVSSSSTCGGRPLHAHSPTPGRRFPRGKALLIAVAACGKGS